MGHLNYIFLDEFKSLDHLCRDIYGTSPDNKLGVTLYLEDMDSCHCSGASVSSSWKSDYNRLKNVRNIRNELVHSRNSITYEICTQDDIDFVCSFKERILNQTDPLALCRKRSKPLQESRHSQSVRCSRSAHAVPQKRAVGCLGVVASFLIAVALAMTYFI